MINKAWHEKYGDESVWGQNYLQEVIDLYFFDSTQIKQPQDINFDNLKEFIETILRHYQYYNINYNRILIIGDIFDEYFYNMADKLFGKSPGEIYLENDRKNLVLHVCENCIQSGTMWLLFPEDVPLVLECLNVQNSDITNMYNKLDQYFNQFDGDKRCNVELPRRYEILKKQRLEALKNNQPLPIRPMGIELDPCYKEGYPKKD